MVVEQRVDLLREVGTIADLVSRTRYKAQDLRDIKNAVYQISGEYDALLSSLETWFHHLTELMLREGMELPEDNSELQRLQDCFRSSQERSDALIESLRKPFNELGDLLEYWS
jgi:hypothetical protein